MPPLFLPARSALAEPLTHAAPLPPRPLAVPRANSPSTHRPPCAEAVPRWARADHTPPHRCALGGMRGVGDGCCGAVGFPPHWGRSGRGFGAADYDAQRWVVAAAVFWDCGVFLIGEGDRVTRWIGSKPVLRALLEALSGSQTIFRDPALACALRS